MCGLVGIVVRKGIDADQELLGRMTSTLRHRGPDANGLTVEGPVGLGHARLAIIDLSREADQPLYGENEEVAVVYNGEIYNFQELRADLIRRGHRFRTRSDTEVLVHAWEEYGERCVEHLRGMFAFAVYDRVNDVVFLARDRMGKKPLFYAWTQEGFVFGSEIKALLQVPGIGSGLDAVAVGEYAAYGNSLGERTIYYGIRKLLPGHSLLVSWRGDDLHVEQKRFWQMRFDPDDGPDEQEWLERLDVALSESIRLRMVSDVPLGVFLSGGIDSSLVVAYMAKHSSVPLKTFTIGFDETVYDESRFARPIAEFLGTDHHTEILQAPSLDILPELVDTYDEPFADLSAVPTWYLCRMARRHVTVALSGDGGDELFLGYDRYPAAYAVDTLGQLVTPLGRMLANRLSHWMPGGTIQQRMLEWLQRTGFDLYDHFMGCTPAVLGLLRDEVRRTFQHPDNKKMATDFSRQTGLSHLERYQMTDLHNYLPDDILVKVDRASMRHSLEVRCPLLDQAVVALAARIPLRYKIGGFDGKRILRRLLARHLPPGMFERPKQGFGVPFSKWLRGDWQSVVAEMIDDQRSPMWEYFDRRSVSAFYREQIEKLGYPQTIWWRLIVFHRWSAMKMNGRDRSAGR